MHRPPDPASRILKYVGSAVHQADVLQYDSECSFAVLSVELWGRCVLDAPSSETLSTWAGVEGKTGWLDSAPRETKAKTNTSVFALSTWKIF